MNGIPPLGTKRTDSMDTQDGVYCSTAGAVFQEREALQEHYHSELHRWVFVSICIQYTRINTIFSLCDTTVSHNVWYSSCGTGSVKRYHPSEALELLSLFFVSLLVF